MAGRYLPPTTTSCCRCPCSQVAPGLTGPGGRQVCRYLLLCEAAYMLRHCTKPRKEGARGGRVPSVGARAARLPSTWAQAEPGEPTCSPGPGPSPRPWPWPWQVRVLPVPGAYRRTTGRPSPWAWDLGTGQGWRTDGQTETDRQTDRQIGKQADEGGFKTDTCVYYLLGKEQRVP